MKTNFYNILKKKSIQNIEYYKKYSTVFIKSDFSLSNLQKLTFFRKFNDFGRNEYTLIFIILYNIQ